MRRALSRQALLCGVLVAAASGAACGRRPAIDPLMLDGNLLTVSNQTPEEWINVEIHLNIYYRVTASSIAAGQRFQVPLDAFVAGYGQRFDFKRAQITDLRLIAKRPDGQPIEVVKQFEKGRLAGALEGFGGKR